MEYTKFTYKQLFELAENKKLVLPNFQRDFVWNPDQQKQLLASFLVNLPIGTLLLLEGEGGEFVSRELCFKNGDYYPSNKCYYLLDGQQRLSTLKNIFSDHLSISSWHETIDNLHYSLRNRWFLNLELRSDSFDIIGLENLRFKIDSKYKFETYEPSDVIDFINPYHIFKTKKRNEFYHPFSQSEKSEYDLKLELASECAAKKIIPLFDLLSDDKVVVKQTLKFISDLRITSLKELVGNNISLAPKYLGHLDPDIETKYRENKQNQYNIRWDSLKEQWIDNVLEYFKDLFKSELIIPTIKSNELARATSVFEYMNKGGTPLDTFDIIIAKYAGIGDEYTLYTRLEDSLKEEFTINPIVSQVSHDITYSSAMIGAFKNDNIIKPIKEQFLNLLSINQKISDLDISHISLADIKRTAHLSLTREKVDLQLESSLNGLNRAIAFLQFRCGIDNFNRFSYRLMLLPIAIFLSKEENWTNISIINKLEYWYWSSLFAGRFREKQNQRIIEDIKLLNEWLINDTNTEIEKRHEVVFSDPNYSDYETLVLEGQDKAVPSAIHSGILSYVLSNMPNDFSEGEIKLKAWEVFHNNTTLQDHHIVPLGSVTKLGESTKKLRSNKTHILNSPLNRVLISNTANNNIKDLSPNRYLPILDKSIVHSQLIPDKILNESEIISEDSEAYQRFLEARFSMIEVSLKRELSAFLN